MSLKLSWWLILYCLFICFWNIKTTWHLLEPHFDEPTVLSNEETLDLTRKLLKFRALINDYIWYITYNIRNISFQMWYAKCVEKLVPDLFWFFKSNPSISLDQQTKSFYSLFLLYARVEDYQKILNLRCWLPAFTSYKA